MTEMTLGHQYVIEKVLYSHDPDGRTDAYARDKAKPWKPMTLAPPGRLSLFITVRMPDDNTGPAVHLWEGITVRYKVLGLSQVRVVPMGFVLGVEKE